MINMPIERFVQTEKAIRYDGTNWSEIEAELGPNAAVTDLGDGVKQVDNPPRDIQTVNPGDYYQFASGSFQTPEDWRAHHLSISLGLPE